MKWHNLFIVAAAMGLFIMLICTIIVVAVLIAIFHDY